MPRDTSLDDFLADAADGDGDGDGTIDGDGDGGEEPLDDPDPATEPAPERSDGDQKGGSRTGESAPDGDGPPVDPAAVDPARPTYGWTPGGAECADCGTTVTRRWRADGDSGTGDGEDGTDRMVCADCKEW